MKVGAQYKQKRYIHVGLVVLALAAVYSNIKFVCCCHFSHSCRVTIEWKGMFQSIMFAWIISWRPLQEDDSNHQCCALLSQLAMHGRMEKRSSLTTTMYNKDTRPKLILMGYKFKECKAPPSGDSQDYAFCDKKAMPMAPFLALFDLSLMKSMPHKIN